MRVSKGPVPGARVAANPRLLSCKYHTHRNVGRKEDFEGPMQVCNKPPESPFWVLNRWPGGTVLYIIRARVRREEYAMYSASVTSENTFDLIPDMTLALHMPTKLSENKQLAVVSWLNFVIKLQAF